MRREELKILADELLREVDAALIDTANAQHHGQCIDRQRA